jgi:hypothetical protein
MAPRGQAGRSERERVGLRDERRILAPNLLGSIYVQFDEVAVGVGT